MPFPERIARLVAHHQRALILTAVGIAVTSVCIIVAAVRFDSQVINLLPAHFNSVKALKIFDQEFEQARELTFVFFDDSGEVDLEGFGEYFAEQARAEPWVVRLMDRTPMEMPEGLRDLQRLAVPMLLNLPEDEFRQAMARLEPEAIRERLERFRQDIAAGSPRAEIQMQFDPLGVVGLALKPLAGTFTLDESEPLTSPDGTLRIVSVVTNQKDLSTYASRALMDKVEAFMKRVEKGWDGPAPRLTVTGRTPYVAEMSGGMRDDIVTTLLSSILLVAAVFYIGFRRVLPLFGIIHTLLLACVAAIAVGGLFLRELNLITIGFCSILVGLGVDFGMLLFGCYQSARDRGEDHERAIASSIRRLGGAVGFGALTTAAAFLCLLCSDSAGFAQLGVLIAIGISFAALFMMTFFFVFAGVKHVPRKVDPILGLTVRAVDFVINRRRVLFAGVGALLLFLSLYAFLPIGVLHFEADPSSLEPRDSKAGEALRAIRRKIPAAKVEPVLVLMKANGSGSAARNWQALDQHWRSLKEQGRISGFTSPAPFAFLEERQKANAASLSAARLEEARDTLESTLDEQGFAPEAFQGAFGFLKDLAAARGDTSHFDWRKVLPVSSPWWFLLDRYFSDNPQVAAAYITPVQGIKDSESKDAFRKTLEVPGIEIFVSGWSYTLVDLIPWSKGKLIELSILMVLVNTVLLLFHVRNPFYLTILMLSLLLATGALIACLKFFNIGLHLFNVLAFPLVLGVGVDYGIYVILAVRESGDTRDNLISLLRPVVMSGLTTVCGFGSLGLAKHPALAGLGVVCGLGIAWCLAITILFTLPACLWKKMP